MQNFFLSFNVVFPIAVLMALGFFLKKIKLMNDVTVKQVNNVIFKAFLPTMIFKNVYDSETSEVFDPKLVIFSVVVAGSDRSDSNEGGLTAFSLLCGCMRSSAIV